MDLGSGLNSAVNITDAGFKSTFYMGADKSLARLGREKVLQRQKILMFIYPIYIIIGGMLVPFVYNKTSIKINILTIKQYTLGI